MKILLFFLLLIPCYFLGAFVTAIPLIIISGEGGAAFIGIPGGLALSPVLSTYILKNGVGKSFLFCLFTSLSIYIYVLIMNNILKYFDVLSTSNTFALIIGLIICLILASIITECVFKKVLNRS